jgi:tetratricopeptide (TPR) repeat protein
MNGLSRTILVLMGCSMICIAGCYEEPVAIRTTRQSVQDVVSADQDDINQGLDQLFRMYEPDPFASEKLGLYHLNQWLLREAKTDHAWKSDPLVSKVSPGIARIQSLEDLPRVRFTSSDFQFLQAKILQRDLTRWVTKRSVEEPLASWLTEQPLDEAERTQLTTVAQVFDWVIRNIQIDPLPEMNAEAGDARWETFAQRGDDGPGFRRYASETMLVSHGDAYERMNLFVHLCRQLELEAVIIGTRRDQQPFQPWVVGVLIGEQIYLFDAEMGLPIPAQNDAGIATLSAVVQEPALLRQLDLDEKRVYRIQNKDLETLEAQLVAMPEELSLRMALLQPRLQGEHKTQVMYQPNVVVERLKKHPQLSPIVKLWDTPFLTSLYCEFGRNIRLSKDVPFAVAWDREMAFLALGQIMHYARRMHFQGLFKQQDVLQGSIFIYMSNRPSEFAMDEIRVSKKYRESVGLEQQLPKNPDQRKRMIELYVERTQRLRENSSFWLGLVQYEQGEYKTAVDWFKTHSLEISPDNFWTRAARYNLARSYEQLGEAEEAAKLYRIDASPQRHGNLIRARRLTAKPATENK